MGYTTEFNGSFQIAPPLSPAEVAYLKKFSETRRMKRTGLPPEYGVDGEFYVDAPGFCGQDRTADIVDYNMPPSTQPSLWCQWVPTDDGTALEWNGAEKFYYYVKWLKYIINNFMMPKGHVLNGQVEWRGEDAGDIGVIQVENNKVKTESSS